MNNKLAKIIDKRTDVMYEISDRIVERMPTLSEKTAEQIADMLINQRHSVLDALIPVKDVPTPKVV